MPSLLKLNRETLLRLDPNMMAGVRSGEIGSGACLPDPERSHGCPTVACPSVAPLSCTCTTVHGSITGGVRTHPLEG